MDQIKTATGKLQSGEEPLSGEQGKGTAGEPYDQGNSAGNQGKSAQEKIGETVEDAKNKIVDMASGKTS